MRTSNTWVWTPAAWSEHLPLIPRSTRLRPCHFGHIPLDSAHVFRFATGVLSGGLYLDDSWLSTRTTGLFRPQLVIQASISRGEQYKARKAASTIQSICLLSCWHVPE